MDEIGIGNKVTLVIKSGVLFFFPCVDNCIIDLFVWTAFRINLVVTKSKLVHLFWSRHHIFLFFPLQECQEFFRLLAVCHTVMVESNNGKNYWFFLVSRILYIIMQTYLPRRLFSFRHFFFREEGRGGGRGWQTVFCPPALIVCIAFGLDRVVGRPISLTQVLFSFVQKYFPG